jgi:pyruvate dehydrogenase (quinone)
VGDRIEFLQTRHEEIAALAATAHAKFTGEVGVCMATSGPGAIHLLNGLYDAKLDHQPVVAIVGQQKRTSLGANYQQEVDLTTLFKDVAAEFVQVCMEPAQARHLIDRAMRVARASRTVTCVIFPNDVQERRTRSRRASTARSSRPAFTSPRVVPRDADSARRRRPAQRGSKRGDPDRARARWAPPTSRGGRRACSARAWPRRSTAARRCPTRCRSSPGRSACSAPSRPTT